MIEQVFVTIIPTIASGIPITLSVAALALIFGGITGLLLAILRVYGSDVLKTGLSVFSTVFRSLPPVVLLFLLYFSVTGTINISAYWATVFSLGLITGVYQMEIFRGSLESIDQGQMMAARAMGLPKFKTVWIIVLPQAIRRSIPPWSNQVSFVIKSSPLVYELGIPEMLRMAQYQIARTRQPFPTYITLAIMYFIIISTINHFLRKLEKATRIPE